jgi:hypothetical protein
MKKLLFTIAFFIVCVTANAQINKDTVGLNLPVRDGQLIYTGVVAVEGRTKDDLYRNAQQWFIDNFYTQKDVIQDKDKEDGLIFGRGIYYFYSTNSLGQNFNWTNHLTMKIECKDNKYRYLFYNMVIYDDSNNYFSIEQALQFILGTQKWSWGTKNVAKRMFISNDVLIKNAVLSLKTAMEKTTDDF